MAKALIPWSETALHLYAQSECNNAGIQALKIVLDTIESSAQKLPLPDIIKDSARSIQDHISGSVFSREQARRSLFALNHDVFVELYFPQENKRYVDPMPYAVCQNKMVDWAKNADIRITWWPVNFKTHEEAKEFVVRYLDSVLRSIKTQTV